MVFPTIKKCHIHFIAEKTLILLWWHSVQFTVWQQVELMALMVKVLICRIKIDMNRAFLVLHLKFELLN